MTEAELAAQVDAATKPRCRFVRRVRYIVPVTSGVDGVDYYAFTDQYDELHLVQANVLRLMCLGQKP